MGSATSAGATRRATAAPRKDDVSPSVIAAVSWALTGTAGTAAARPAPRRTYRQAHWAVRRRPLWRRVGWSGHAVGPCTRLRPEGLGRRSAEARTAVEITPLGVSAVGVLLLSRFFLRSPRTTGVGVMPTELLIRAGTVLALFVAMPGGLARAGHDVIALDGGSPGPARPPGAGDEGDEGGDGSPTTGTRTDRCPTGPAVSSTPQPRSTPPVAAPRTPPPRCPAAGPACRHPADRSFASRRTPPPGGRSAVHRSYGRRSRRSSPCPRSPR
ncbi:hypothetical protein AB0L59_30610 [Streptomyces sp. NPDC052109]|uniref:hypothetical protein n=1 Tax=Streptomyces sp. NPDC052109 TaxID=3155527 RepID=UPI0034385C94